MRHFGIEELTASATAKRLGIANTPDAGAIEALKRLVEQVLDPLSESWGKPIVVNSGYRSEELNRRVGGVAASQHLRGEAADITAGSCASNHQLFALLRRLDLPVDQAIEENGGRGLHVSHTSRRRNRGHYVAAK